MTRGAASPRPAAARGHAAGRVRHDRRRPPGQPGAARAERVDGYSGAVITEPIDDLLWRGLRHPLSDQRLGDDGKVDQVEKFVEVFV